VICDHSVCSGNFLCPVALYKEFVKRRDPGSFSPDSPFYVKPLKTPVGSIWFSCQPLGKNTIASIVRNMACDAGLTGKRVTNRSAQKTSSQTLLLADIPPTVRDQVTWYINVQPLENYSTGSIALRDDVVEQCNRPCDPDTPVDDKHGVIRDLTADEYMNVTEHGQQTVKLEATEEENVNELHSISSKQTCDSDDSSDDEQDEEQEQDDEQDEEHNSSSNGERFEVPHDLLTPVTGELLLGE